MIIQPDPISPVQQTGQVQQTTRSAPSQNFGEVLAKEVDSVQAAQTAAAAPSIGGVAGLTQALAAQAATGVREPTTGERAVMDNVDNLLNQWEKYADQLASSQTSGSLRQAYGMLENIQSGVQKLKDENPGLAGQSPQLSSLVNELEVLTVTEQIKFNRGDYL